MKSKQENFVIRYQEQIRVTSEAEKAAATGNIPLKNQLLKEKERYDTGSLLIPEYSPL